MNFPWAAASQNGFVSGLGAALGDGVFAAITGLGLTWVADMIEGYATIIELMDDSDDNVRDWATFALGTQCSVNSPEILNALRKRLNDSYEMARNEAVWGLAQHKDPLGIKMLIERLEADEWMTGECDVQLSERIEVTRGEYPSRALLSFAL